MPARKNILTGTISLTNTKLYPFNDSVQTVALEAARENRDYIVQTEVISSAGEVGDIVISGKAVNGFKIAFTGSAKQAVIKYYVTGGFE
jgi:hypothetical protein